ncbi:UvrD-helicase domain-containing protein [Sphingobium yanoikuyae]|uniref:UvrD-helicase domain-containing protein n=1 Tax=Sphingobium yanoikuyae TaxID=13690 RepID=UPI0028A64A5D|nr:UvrD-helicase domain-containing protein [Sphingobium yanoikuyae]
MSYDALVIDEGAIAILDTALIESNWFGAFELPENSAGLRRAVVDNIVYLLSPSVDIGDGLLVVDIGANGIFANAVMPQARFERVLRVALRKFDRNISLPVQWQPYHEGSRLSVFGEPVNRRSNVRIYFDQAAGAGGDLYAYGVTDGPKPLSLVAPDNSLYARAVSNLEAAALAETPPAPDVGNFGILLSEPLGRQISGAATLQEWLERKLNPQQLAFVKKSHDQPVRLRGAAGTGKTQAMTIKCINDLLEDVEGDNTKTFAFLTHSSALAHDVIRGMFSALDPKDTWRTTRTVDGQPKLWIGTLYELAEERLSYAQKGLRPLSLDGQEGREYQRILIEDAIAKTLADPRLMLDILSDEAEFQQLLSSLNKRATLVEDLMNEFAGVLDAENIRKGTPEADRYLGGGSRENWQMPLNSRAQREAVLEIHDAYRALLKHERLLSMDQMTADFGRYLTTHEWEQLREKLGFDVIFVDEYHYFSRNEAMTLQGIFRSRAGHSGKWPLLMAYDLKQSTSDAALGGGVERFRNPGVGVSSFVDLKENYRSTPEITKLLQDLDASFPAMDLEGEYDTHIASSDQEHGDVPVLKVYDRDQDLLDGIFNEAVADARRLGGRKVAVLCLNELLFDRYLKAARINGKYVPLTTREDLKGVQYARGRCIFSMPEYVAGLQFDAVYLLHADQSDLSDEMLSQGARRRYVHRMYLGASRAQKKLVISTSLERGGKSEVLDGALHSKSLIRFDVG